MKSWGALLLPLLLVACGREAPKAAVEAPKLATIEGRILDASGAAIAGTQLAIEAAGRSKVMTLGPDGRFRGSLPTGIAIRFAVVAPDGRRVDFPALFSDAAATPHVEVRLGDAPTVAWDTADRELDEMARLVPLIEKARLAPATAADVVASLERAMGDAAKPRLAAWAAVERSQFPPGSDPSLRERILAVAPESSPMWSFAPAGLVAVAGTDEAALERLASSAPELETRDVALAQLVERARRAGDRARADELYERLAKAGALRPGSSAAYWAAELDPKRPLQVGRPLPPLDVPLLGGGRLTNADLAGHWTLLDFWSTTCVPCMAEMPNLDAAWKRDGKRGLRIVSLSFDDAGVVEKFRHGRWPMPWTQALVPGGFESDLAKSWGIGVIPQPLLIAPDGTIAAIDQSLRGETLAKTLDAKLGS